MSETKVLGVPISEWDLEELIYVSWHAVMHLTDEEKREILQRAKAAGIERPQP